MELVQAYPALARPERPLCSVCIANYNGAEMLANCIDSVLGQRCDFDFEIILHDDASTDNSITLLRSRYPQVELLHSTKNVGFCISNNRMVTHARGKYVLLLNNDAILYEDALATLFAEASSDASPGILTLPQYDMRSNELIDRGCFLDPFYNPVPNLDSTRHNVAMVIGACLWTPRKLWNELGGFPEWMGSLAEDMYLCCAARQRGRTVRVALESGYRHWQGSSFGGNRVIANKLHTTYRRRRLSELNKSRILIIFTPTALVWPLLVIHLLLLTVEGSALSILRHDLQIWREIYWHTLASMYHERLTLKSMRTHMQRLRVLSCIRYFDAFVLFPHKLALFFRHGVPSIWRKAQN